MPVFESATVKVDRDNDGSFVLVIDVPGKPARG